jgi:hypothetical protein
MSNKHTNHQHGLHTMNATRPKSKLRKRKNKAGAKARKVSLLEALHESRYGKKVVKTSVKKTTAQKGAAKKAKAEKKAAKAPATKKPAAKAKKPATKKA